MRAFLSHSSSDKAFVGQVAELLGRARVLYDAYEFATGDELHRAIVNAIDRADLFVLLASDDALLSEWVRKELEVAEAAVAAKVLSKAVCYIIDDRVQLRHIPSWMKDCLVSRQTNPRLVALDIRRILNERIATRKPRYFIGRNDNVDDALELITRDVNPLIAYGLSGIGRRSLLAEVGRNHLSYAKHVEIGLRAGDELAEFLLYLRDHLGLVPIGRVAELLAEYAALAPTEITAQIVATLGEICQSGTLPIIIDAGATTDGDGRLLDGFQLLFDELRKGLTVHLGVVALRRVRHNSGTPHEGVRVTELDPTSTQRLVRLLAGHEKISITKDQIESISVYVAGYPPAAQFAIQEVRTYGAEHVNQNQRTIVNFNERVFISQIVADKKINAPMQKVLQLLSAYSPLPLEVISDYVGDSTSEDLNEWMTHLIDFSFIVPKGLHYRIASPIRDAAYRSFSGMYVDHSLVAHLLEQYLSANDDDEVRLDLAQSLFRALSYAGSARESAFAVSFARDLIQMTEQLYYDENYDRVLEFGDRAIEARPRNIDVRRFVAQALIRKERYDEAEGHIKKMIELGALREAFYVRGFLERRRHRPREAIDAYKQSVSYGRGGVAVHRELAQCYFQVGDLEHAREHIQQAERFDPHNRFVVDLQCKIAMQQRDKSETERCLRVLERIDAGGFASHRRSTFELAQGNFEEALRYATLAVENSFRPPFEISANLANCQIEAGELEAAAATLQLLDQKNAATNHDTRAGLRCKLELRKGHTDVAEALWRRIRDHSLPVHKGLRVSILRQRLSASALSAEETAELEALELELAKLHAVQFGDEWDDA